MSISKFHLPVIVPTGLLQKQQPLTGLEWNQLGSAYYPNYWKEQKDRLSQQFEEYKVET